MTISEIIDSAWIDCGEPSDINPDDTEGTEFFLRSLNLAMDAVVSWKGYQGRRRSKFPNYITKMFVKNTISTDLEIYDFPTSDPLVDSATWMADDVIQLTNIPATMPVAGDIAVYNDEERLIYNVVSSAPLGPELYLSEAFSSYDSDISTIDIYQTVLDPNLTRFVDYLRVENVSENTTLDLMSKRSSNIDDIDSIGIPSEWKRTGSKIEFDTTPDEVYLWRLWYYRLPTQVTAISDDAFDVPDEFHPAIKDYIEALVYDHMQELELSVGMFSGFDQKMKTTQGSWERNNILSETNVMGIQVS